MPWSTLDLTDEVVSVSFWNGPCDELGVGTTVGIGASAEIEWLKWLKAQEWANILSDEEAKIECRGEGRMGGQN
jgi:hypothetical protein